MKRIVVLLALGCLRLPAALKAPIPISVRQLLLKEAPAGAVDTASEPVSIGVPLPPGAVSIVGGLPQLGVLCDGVELPQYQFRVLGTWPDGSAKWVLATFLQAKTLRAGDADEGSYTITNGAGSKGGASMAQDGIGPGDTANANYVRVDTGAAKFYIRKRNSNLIDQVVVKGRPVVASGAAASKGIVVAGPSPSTMCAANGNNGSATFGGAEKPHAWTEYTSQNDPGSSAEVDRTGTTVAIYPDNGPIRAVVKVKGLLRDRGGFAYLGYTARLYFYRGSSAARVVVEMKNGYAWNPDIGSANTQRCAVNSTSNAKRGRDKELVFLEFQQGLASKPEGNTWTVSTAQAPGRAASATGVFSKATDQLSLYQKFAETPGMNGQLLDWTVVGYQSYEIGYSLLAGLTNSASRVGLVANRSRFLEEGYETRLNDVPIPNASGGRKALHDGWLDVRDAGGAGVEAIQRLMAYYFPRSLDAADGGRTLRVGMLPRHKTSPMMQPTYAYGFVDKEPCPKGYYCWTPAQQGPRVQGSTSSWKTPGTYIFQWEHRRRFEFELNYHGEALDERGLERAAKVYHYPVQGAHSAEWLNSTGAQDYYQYASKKIADAYWRAPNIQNLKKGDPIPYRDHFLTIPTYHDFSEGGGESQRDWVTDWWSRFLYDPTHTGDLYNFYAANWHLIDHGVFWGEDQVPDRYADSASRDLAEAVNWQMKYQWEHNWFYHLTAYYFWTGDEAADEAMRMMAFGTENPAATTVPYMTHGLSWDNYFTADTNGWLYNRVCYRYLMMSAEFFRYFRNKNRMDLARVFIDDSVATPDDSPWKPGSRTGGVGDKWMAKVMTFRVRPTRLTADISPADRSITVEDATGYTRGYYTLPTGVDPETGKASEPELIYVCRVERNRLIVDPTACQYGRGARGTAAGPHRAGTTIAQHTGLWEHRLGWLEDPLSTYTGLFGTQIQMDAFRRYYLLRPADTRQATFKRDLGDLLMGICNFFHNEVILVRDRATAAAPAREIALGSGKRSIWDYGHWIHQPRRQLFSDSLDLFSGGAAVDFKEDANIGSISHDPSPIWLLGMELSGESRWQDWGDKWLRKAKLAGSGPSGAIPGSSLTRTGSSGWEPEQDWVLSEWSMTFVNRRLAEAGGPPAPVQNATVTALGGDRYRVSWTAPPGVTGYRLKTAPAGKKMVENYGFNGLPACPSPYGKGTPCGPQMFDAEGMNTFGAPGAAVPARQYLYDPSRHAAWYDNVATRSVPESAITGAMSVAPGGTVSVVVTSSQPVFGIRAVDARGRMSRMTAAVAGSR